MARSARPIRQGTPILLDPNEEYATLLHDCQLLYVTYSNDKEDKIVQGKKGDKLCIGVYESINGGIHYDKQDGDSPRRYYYIQRDVLQSMYKHNIFFAETVDPVFLARKVAASENEGTLAMQSPNPDIHPLKKERTIVIFHCLVTGMNPSQDDYEYKDGERRGVGA
jgi:hypothetical protein